MPLQSPCNRTPISSLHKRVTYPPLPASKVTFSVAVGFRVAFWRGGSVWNTWSFPASQLSRTLDKMNCGCQDWGCEILMATQNGSKERLEAHFLLKAPSESFCHSAASGKWRLEGLDSELGTAPKQQTANRPCTKSMSPEGTLGIVLIQVQKGMWLAAGHTAGEWQNQV